VTGTEQVFADMRADGSALLGAWLLGDQHAVKTIMDEFWSDPAAREHRVINVASVLLTIARVPAEYGHRLHLHDEYEMTVRVGLIGAAADLLARAAILDTDVLTMLPAAVIMGILPALCRYACQGLGVLGEGDGPAGLRLLDTAHLHWVTP
jgi:hypothetical protein